MSVRFVIDSASDVLPHEAAALDVCHVPMKVLFGDREYADSVTLTHQEFFAKLATSKELPTTCQVPPADFEAACETFVKQGHQVVVITLSSALSGTYQSAVIAAEEFEGQVFVVDSKSAAVGERVLLMYGLQLAQQGMDAAQVAQILTEKAEKVHVVAVLDTLEYLKKGGRISSATALAGSLLAIKPAIEVKDGAVAMAGTARGAKKANLLLQQIVDGYGIDYHMPVAFTYARDRSLLDQLIEQCPQLWEQEGELPAHSLGCTIGTHVGPGAYGIAFFEK